MTSYGVRSRQVACTRLALDGTVVVDFRYLTDSLPGQTETEIWTEVQHRRNPGLALFVEDRCVEKGDFPSLEAATLKLKSLSRRG